MLVLVLISLVACAAAAPCVHNNHNDLTEEHVISMVIANADHDSDGIITGLDLAEFLADWDVDGNFEIHINEFADRWVTTYHDERSFAEHVFQHLDSNDSGVLELYDLPQLIKRVDTSADGQIQMTEFKVYLESIYQAC